MIPDIVWGTWLIDEQPRDPSVTIVDNPPSQPVVGKLEADTWLFSHVQHQGLGFRIFPVRIEELSHRRRVIFMNDRRDDWLL